MIDLDLFLGSRPLKSVLCIVAETSGSCPGRVGFKMIVPPEGACKGSVGGGSMEFQVITKARQMLLSCEEKPCMVSFDHSATAEPQEKSGMICSGRQKIVLVPSSLFKYELEGKQGFQVDNSGLNLLDTPPDYPGLSADGNSWQYTEEIAPPPTVYIFGGGHCGLALTSILNTLDLRVVIIDDREHVWTMEENEAAWKKIVRDYADVSSLVPDSGDALVVIMTASHAGDSVVLRQMLPEKKNLKYLGMMASKVTSKHVLGEMRSLGFSQEDLSTVHTPIGIPISSQTPAEIAVSIAAEIIMVLNKR
ncbi:MAG: XdhC/CoxI family protein [Candidatus Fermentibacteria bacterium]|nr:XdhC/CoxI family protein [Candidatus Fermentibacteria bacterium]